MTIKNKIKELNKNKLNKLDISGLKIKDGVPKELTKTLSDSKSVVLKIIELDLSFNQIKFNQFMEEYGNMSNEFSVLETLNLSGNPENGGNGWNMSIIKSPQSIQRWNQLLELNLSGCKLGKLLSTSFQHLSKLKKLVISNTSLEMIEDQVFSPFKSTLEELTIAGNSSIKALPSSLLDCKQLEVLDLSGCTLNQLPDLFGACLTSILELNLGNNKLTELPNSIGRMKRLCFLNLQDNLLQDLPLSIGYCVGLGQSSPGINIYGNPLAKNQELNLRKSRGASEIMDYLEKRVTLHIGPVPLGGLTTPPSPVTNSRPPSYEKINDIRPPRYSNIGVSSSPILPSSTPPSPQYILNLNNNNLNNNNLNLNSNVNTNVNNNNNNNNNLNINNNIINTTLFEIPGPKPIKDQIQIILRVDIKTIMKRIFEAVSLTNNVSPPIQQQQLVAIGNTITPAQQELDKLFACLGIKTDHFTFNSPIPSNSDEKIAQIKKIINLKLEKIALFSRSLLEYIDHQNQYQSNSPDYDKRISLIFNSLNQFTSKLNKI
ncbi:hypothetical protein ACTFIV_005912 [Dictyostelium citrinum]